MKLEDIVTSKDLSVKLKDKGFPQKSLHTWWVGKTESYLHRKWDGRPLPRYSAPTAEELLKELPKNLNEGCLDNINLRILCHSNYVQYFDVNRDKIKFSFSGDGGKLTNALAKMWLYLKDNKLIK